MYMKGSICYYHILQYKQDHKKKKKKNIFAFVIMLYDL
jgi:hypothetical protein